MNKEKFIGESTIRDAPHKKLSLVLRDGAVTTDKIADEAVTTEKIADGAVTKDKFSDNILDDIKSDTEESMQGKFLPLSGGEMQGPISYRQTNEDGVEQTMALDAEKAKFNGDGVSTNVNAEGVAVESTMPGMSSSAVLGLESLKITRRTSVGEYNVMTADKDGVEAEGFKTNDQSKQGLLVNDGTVMTAIRPGKDSNGKVVDGAVAEGYNTVANNNNAHAEGANSQATGANAHAEGTNTFATGYGAHAEGAGTHAEGTNSHAEGNYTWATEANSHAEGYNTQAKGYCSHTEGGLTTASGKYSHAEGYHNYDNKNFIRTLGVGGNLECNAEAVYVGRNTSGSIDETDPKHGYKYILGIGGYKGRGIGNAKSLQEVIAGLPTDGTVTQGEIDEMFNDSKDK